MLVVYFYAFMWFPLLINMTASAKSKNLDYSILQTKDGIQKEQKNAWHNHTVIRM